MIFLVTHDTKSKFYTNIVGKFPILSISRNRYIFIWYNKDRNIILPKPLKTFQNV